MGNYEQSTEVKLEAVFRNEQTGNYADPTNIIFYLLNPNGVETILAWPPLNISRDSVGHFHLTVIASSPGTYKYKWRGSSGVVATSPDGSFTVNGSVLPLILFDASTTRITADTTVITADTF